MQLSETAQDVLLTAVKRAELADGRCLRLMRSDADDGYTLTIDMPRGTDTVIQKDGTSLLVLAKNVEESLKDATIEVKEDEGTFQLLVYRPAA